MERKIEIVLRKIKSNLSAHSILCHTLPVCVLKHSTLWSKFIELYQRTKLTDCQLNLLLQTLAQLRAI